MYRWSSAFIVTLKVLVSVSVPFVSVAVSVTSASGCPAAGLATTPAALTTAASLVVQLIATSFAPARLSARFPVTASAVSLPVKPRVMLSLAASTSACELSGYAVTLISKVFVAVMPFFVIVAVSVTAAFGCPKAGLVTTPELLTIEGSLETQLMETSPSATVARVRPCVTAAAVSLAAKPTERLFLAISTASAGLISFALSMKLLQPRNPAIASMTASETATILVFFISPPP